MKYLWTLPMATSLLASSILLIGACSQESRYQVLSTVFEGVPSPGQTSSQWQPVVRVARRPPPPTSTPTPAPVKVAIGERRELGRDWLAAVLPTLPKDKSGKPDMARALNEKLIAPRPGIAPDAKAQAVLDLNVELVPKTQPAMKVVFSHKAHTQWLACGNCHTAIFKMKKGADPITMATIYAGQYCGRCHGKVAFAVPTGCARCHLLMGGGK